MELVGFARRVLLQERQSLVFGVLRRCGAFEISASLRKCPQISAKLYGDWLFLADAQIHRRVIYFDQLRGTVQPRHVDDSKLAVALAEC